MRKLLLSLQYPQYPLAMYQVSGEYAMFWHASKAGAIDLRAVLLETLQGMRRAGMSHLSLIAFCFFPISGGSRGLLRWWLCGRVPDL